MDPGTALGIASLAIALPPLLETCLHGFDLFTAGRKQAETSKKFLVMLDLHKLRLLCWGRMLGLTNELDRPMNGLLNDPTYRVPIENGLRQLESLFTDAKVLESRYGVKLELYNPNQIDEPQSVFCGTYDRYVQRLRKGSQLPKMTKWAIHDEAKFQKMLDDINLLLSSLESLNGSFGIQPQRAVEHTIAELSSEHDLRLVQSAAVENGFRLTGQVAHQRLLSLNPDATPLEDLTFSVPLSRESTYSYQLSTEHTSPERPPTQSYFPLSATPPPQSANSQWSSLSPPLYTAVASPSDSWTHGQHQTSLPSYASTPSAAFSTTSAMRHYDEAAWTTYVVAQPSTMLQELKMDLDKKIAWSRTAVGVGIVGSLLTAGVTLAASVVGARTNYVYTLQREAVMMELRRRGIAGKREAAKIEKEKAEAAERVRRWALEDKRSGKVPAW